MRPLNFKFLQVPAVLFYTFPTASKSKRTKHYCTRQIQSDSNSEWQNDKCRSELCQRFFKIKKRLKNKKKRIKRFFTSTRINAMYIYLRLQAEKTSGDQRRPAAWSTVHLGKRSATRLHQLAVDSLVHFRSRQHFRWRLHLEEAPGRHRATADEQFQLQFVSDRRQPATGKRSSALHILRLVTE